MQDIVTELDEIRRVGEISTVRRVISAIEAGAYAEREQRIKARSGMAEKEVDKLAEIYTRYRDDIPSCTNAVHFVWWRSAEKRESTFKPHRFCRDCTPAMKREMMIDGRCDHPDVFFVWAQEFPNNERCMLDIDEPEYELVGVDPHGRWRPRNAFPLTQEELGAAKSRVKTLNPPGRPGNLF